MNPISLDGHFQSYFQIVPARTLDMLERIFRIRYDVYCREFGYEKEEDCPGGLEHDDYDEAALHCLIVHRETGAGAGCIRLVVQPPDQPNFLLPMERFCADSLTDPIWHPARLPRSQIAEVSRLAVHTQFRRRLGESESPVGIAPAPDFNAEERRTFPLLSLALFYAGAALMKKTQREHAFVMVEPRLTRRMLSLGLPFRQIGEPMEYHGTRAGYYVQVQEVLDKIPDGLKSLYEFVFENLGTWENNDQA